MLDNLLGNNKKQPEINPEDVDKYLKAQLVEVSKYLKFMDERIKNVENGKQQKIPPQTPEALRIQNLEIAVVNLSNQLNELIQDHLLLKSVARYRKEYKHLQPEIPNIKHQSETHVEQHRHAEVIEDEIQPSMQQPKIEEPIRVSLPKMLPPH